MKRRSFLKGCLSSLCFLPLIAAKTKPKTKKIKLYVSSEKTKRPGVDRLCYKIVEYSGKGRVRPGDLMVWCEDGTVCKATRYAGVAKCVI